MASFSERLKEAKRFLDDLPQPLLLVGHLDTDGLSTTAVLERICKYAGKEYSIKILPQISKVFVNRLPKAKSYVFMDGGSALLDELPTPALVIDHHQLPTQHAKNVFVLNPLLDGLDGAHEACSATIACRLATLYDLKGHNFLGVLGFTGDAQDKQGVVGINAEIRDAALLEKSVVSLCAPRLFGVYSKPLIKLIMKSGDLRIKGITNDYRGTQEFLNTLNLPAKQRFSDLQKHEQEKLVRALKEQKELDEIEHFGLTNYESPLCDVRQFATFLNACGRLAKSEVGLAFLRGESPCNPQELLGEYAGALREATQWAKEKLTAQNGLVVLNAKDMIAPVIAGTLCSILVRGRIVASGTVVLALARYADGLTKVSVRARAYDLNLFTLVQDAATAVSGEFGGHAVAAGAIIDTSREQEFIEYIVKKHFSSQK